MTQLLEQRVKKGYDKDLVLAIPLDEIEASPWKGMLRKGPIGKLAKPLFLSEKDGQLALPLATEKSGEVDQQLVERIQSIIKRRIEDVCSENCDQNPILKIALHQEAINKTKYYVISHFDSIIDTLLENQEHPLMAYAEKAVYDEFGKIKEYFSGIIDRVFLSPAGVETMLEVVSKGYFSIIEQSTHSAFLSMLMLNRYSKVKNNKEIIDIGTAALFKDISVVLAPDSFTSEDKVHAQHSAKILRDIGLSEEIVDAVSSHHLFYDSEGRPLYEKPSNVPLFSKIITVVDIFTKLAPSKGAVSSYRFMQEHLAGKRLLDQEAVDIIADLYLPRGRENLSKMSYELLNRCPVDSDFRDSFVMFHFDPIAIMCNKTGCAHQDSSAKSIIFNPQAVQGEFESLGIDILSKINEGEYYSCSFLTRLLKELTGEETAYHLTDEELRWLVHDLANPLQIMRGYIEIYRSSSNISNKIVDDISDMVEGLISFRTNMLLEGTQKVEVLIKQLRSFQEYLASINPQMQISSLVKVCQTRVGEIFEIFRSLEYNPSRYDLAEKVRAITAYYKDNNLLDGIDLRVKSLDNVETYSDPRQVSRVLHNLLNNAISACLTRKEHEDSYKPQILLKVGYDNDKAYFCCIDNAALLNQGPNNNNSLGGYGHGLRICTDLIAKQCGQFKHIAGEDFTLFYCSFPTPK